MDCWDYHWFSAALTIVFSCVQEEKAGLADLTNLVALNPKKKIPFELVEKIELSHNTRLFRFALQSPRHRLGLPVGQHMFFYAKVLSPIVISCQWTAHCYPFELESFQQLRSGHKQSKDGCFICLMKVVYNMYKLQ